MASLSRLFALIIKELLALLRDPMGRRVLLIPPLLQLTIFAFAATQDVTNVSIVVLNKDAGAHGFELVQRLKGAPPFAHVTLLTSQEQIRPAIDEQRALIAIQINEDFSRLIASGQPASVQIIVDGRRSNSAQIVEGYATQIINTYNQDLGATTPTTLVTRNWFNPNLNFFLFTVPCLVGIIPMIGCIIVTALSVARERELGTYDQLLVSPLTPLEILVGKTIPGLLVGLVQASLVLAAGVACFKIPVAGSLLLLYASLMVFLLSVVGIGLFVSTLAHTQQQAVLGTFTLVAPMVMLSGFATPVENMPAWLQSATLAIPLQHFLIVVKGVLLKGMPASEVIANTWPMVIIGMVTLIGASWFFRRKLE